MRCSPQALMRELAGLFTTGCFVVVVLCQRLPGSAWLVAVISGGVAAALRCRA